MFVYVHLLFILSATEELVEVTSSASPFVETGYIFGVHGLHGEVRVKSSTDFPDLRFSKVRLVESRKGTHNSIK